MALAIVVAPAFPMHQGRIVNIESAGTVAGELEDGSDAYEGFWTTPILDSPNAPGVPYVYGAECFVLLPPEEQQDVSTEEDLSAARHVCDFIAAFS